MSILNKDEFLQAVGAIVGDRTDEASTQFIENMTDTFNSLSQADGVNWEQRYKENDEAWRKRYNQRFMSGAPTYTPAKPSVETVEKTVETIDDLFK